MKFPKLKNKAILAPMAGINDIAFRALCKKYGASLTYTELMSSTALVRNNENIVRLKKESKVRPVSVQLFGANIEEIVQAAQQVEDYFDIIDINCGCPAHKVIRSGAGSELMKNPAKIAEIVHKLVSAVNKPVTIKIRAGPDYNNINALEVAKLVENAGAAAIAIHGRTKNQGYRTTANWDIVKEVKRHVKIPVIGNGDITTPEIFNQRMKQSRVDYIMIGREAIKNPYIFTQVNDFLKKKKYKQYNKCVESASKHKMKIIKDYLKLTEKYQPSFTLIKNHIIQFTKNTANGAQKRLAISRCKNQEDLKKILQS